MVRSSVGADLKHYLIVEVHPPFVAIIHKNTVYALMLLRTVAIIAILAPDHARSHEQRGIVRDAVGVSPERHRDRGYLQLGVDLSLDTGATGIRGVLVRHRGNVQKVAAEMGVAYNTARSRLDDVVAALGEAGQRDTNDQERRNDALQRLAAGEIAFAEAMRQVKG